MSLLLVVSAEALSGKTTVAVALGARLKEAGKSISFARLAGDGHADADASLYSSLPFNDRPAAGPVERPGAVEADLTVLEAPAEDSTELAASLSARAVVVGAYADPLFGEILSTCRALGESCAGVVITRTPARRLEATREVLEDSGVPFVALIPEDRTLAAPPLGAVAEALEVESVPQGVGQRVMDRPIVSSIAVDPSQGYFTRQNPDAVLVRGDKPDQQLGALHAGVPCLIVTGGLPVLSYIEERAEEDDVPILRTGFDTLTAIQRVEPLYAATPFAGDAKVSAVAGLTADWDVSSLA